MLNGLHLSKWKKRKKKESSDDDADEYEAEGEDEYEEEETADKLTKLIIDEDRTEDKSNNVVNENEIVTGDNEKDDNEFVSDIVIVEKESSETQTDTDC